MSGPSSKNTPSTAGGNETPNTNTDNLQELILAQMSSLKELIKEHNSRSDAVTPIRLDFEDGTNDRERDNDGATGDDDLRKPFKETTRSPFTQRIVQFSAPGYVMPLNMRLYDGTTDPSEHLTRFSGAGQHGDWPMPIWCRMFQQTLDGVAAGWFDRLEPNSIDSWGELREQFLVRFSLRKKNTKDPTEITKIVRRAHESLPDFKERWTDEASYISGCRTL